MGPNGAGKTTLFGVLATALAPDHGSFSHGSFSVNRDRPVDKRSQRNYRERLGVVPQRLHVFEGYTCVEFLRYVAWLRRVAIGDVEEQCAEALETVGLSDHTNSKVKTLSGGMHQRLALASGLVNHPHLLLLDEPTAGLDPLQRAEFLSYLRGITAATVVMATHLVEDVVATAQEVLVLSHGKAVFAGDLQAFCRTHGRTITGTDVERAYRRVLGSDG